MEIITERILKLLSRKLIDKSISYRNLKKLRSKVAEDVHFIS